MKYDNDTKHPRTVLVFSGSDPSCGAGLQADLLSINALGAHPLSVVTVLTVQDHNHVHATQAVDPDFIRAQAEVLIQNTTIDAIKIGALGSVKNAHCVTQLLRELRVQYPHLPIVFDPVLVSGHGDALAKDDMGPAFLDLYPLASIVTPNQIEATKLSGFEDSAEQASWFIDQGAHYALIKGGHGASQEHVINIGWANDGSRQQWLWPRLAHAFHGSGCTLASAIATYLAHGLEPHHAVEQAQVYCQKALTHAYMIGEGQHIPNRMAPIRMSDQSHS